VLLGTVQLIQLELSRSGTRTSQGLGTAKVAVMLPSSPVQAGEKSGIPAGFEKYMPATEKVVEKRETLLVEEDNVVLVQKNGQLDMLTSWSLVTSHVLTVISNPGIRVLPVDKADEILKDPRLNGYFKVILKKGAHEGVPEDMPMMVSYLTLCLSADIPDDLAYKIAKVFFETPPLKEFYKREAEVGLGESFDLKNSYLAANIPHHPGVEKYFKEKGARLR